MSTVKGLTQDTGTKAAIAWMEDRIDSANDMLSVHNRHNFSQEDLDGAIEVRSEYGRIIRLLRLKEVNDRKALAFDVIAMSLDVTHDPVSDSLTVTGPGKSVNLRPSKDVVGRAAVLLECVSRWLDK